MIPISIVVLVLIVLLLTPAWPYSVNWGYGPSGLALLILIVVLLFLATNARASERGFSDRRAWECAKLYTLRNNFYDRRGLCFTRNTAKEVFPRNESTCRYDSSRDLPISAREKQMIDQIVAEERSLGCPRI